MAFKHGVYINESETALRPTVPAPSALPVVFGTAPIHMLEDPEAAINRPILASSLTEAVEQMGFVGARDGMYFYTLSEFAHSFFTLFGSSPAVFVNVLGSRPEHKKQGDLDSVEVKQGLAEIYATGEKGIIRSSIVVKDSTDTTTYVEGTDYTVSYNRAGLPVVAAIDGGAITEGELLNCTFDYYDIGEVDEDDIIGGVDPTTLAPTGLELVDNVFSMYRLVPGTIVAPMYSGWASVAAVMDAKASVIAGHFKAQAIVDIPTDVVSRYSEVPAWKNDNNITGEHTIACWPALSLGGTVYNFSTQLAGLLARTDASSGGIPYLSPSNKSLQMDSAVIFGDEGPEEVVIPPNIGAYLNGQGIVTAMNFIGGWVAWGNHTAAFPANTDPVKSFISIRRMFSWVGNTLTLNNWQHLDAPLDRRQIQTVTASNGQWLNSLVATGALLGGSIDFLEEDNPDVQLMAGESVFRVALTPPSPNGVIHFVLGYDVSYLQTLFSE